MKINIVSLIKHGIWRATGKRMLACLLVGIFPLFAVAEFNPTAYYILDGEQMEATDAITDAQAPLDVTFRANASNLNEGSTVSYEWRFVKNDETEPFLIRYENETKFEFRESGTFDVSLYVSYDAENEPEKISTIRITISTSMLEFPNAFSPNGDGINDIYKAKDNYKSIIEFHAYIFNRWGQKLYEWTDVAGGWDGTYKGSPVADGVYFVLVEAKGADGRDYKIRRDVNILRRYLDEGGTGNQ